MGKAGNGQRRGGKALGKNSRKSSVNRELIDAYRGDLCLRKFEDFLGALATYRVHREEERTANGQLHGKASVNQGPSPATIREVLITGKATGAIEDLILGTLQYVWDDLYGKDGGVPQSVPRPMNLQKFPPGYPRSADAEPGRLGAVLTRAEYFAEVSRMIRDARTKAILYTSIGAGFWLKNVIDTMGDEARPMIQHIVARTISKRYANSLVRLKLLKPSFSTDLGNNIEALQGKTYRNGKVIVKERHWKGMSPFHGTMYGDDVLFYGPWQLGFGGLNTVMGPVRRLIKGDALFETYRNLLVNGD